MGEWISSFFERHIKLGQETLPFSWGDFALKAVLPVLAFFIFYRILLHVLKKRLVKAAVKPRRSARIFRIVRLILRLGFTVFMIIMVALLFGARIFSYVSKVFEVLRTPFFTSGSTHISIFTIILAIPVFYLAAWIAKLLRRVLEKSLLDKLNIDSAKKFSISSILRYGILVVMLLIGFSIIGINLSSIAVIFGVLGLGVGFGLQNVVANFFAGLVIIITRPVKEGDRIHVGEMEGDVVKIRLQSSVINTLTNETIIIPNSQLVSEKVYNFSYDDPSILTKNEVQVSYGSNLDKVLDVLMDVGLRNPFGIPGEVPIVRVMEFASSGIAMYLFIKIKDVRQKYNAISWTNLEIWRVFKKHKIEIPFTQVDLHIK